MIYFVIAAIVLAALVLLYFYLVCPSLRKHRGREILDGRFIAHRGLHSIVKDTPENSLKSFLLAADYGYAIEIDIHLTRDGEVVVFHDDDLKRMCGVDRKIGDMTLKEIKKCRLMRSGHAIPTLSECLAAVNGKVPLLIEFKCASMSSVELCDAADKLLTEYDGEYLIQSFYPSVLRWYRFNRKEVCRGQLATDFKNAPLYKKMLGAMLFNFLGRPDFVSFEHSAKRGLGYRMAKKMGAYPVGWTYTNQEDLNKTKEVFNAYIFENFIPK